MNKGIGSRELRILAIPFSDEVKPGDVLADKLVAALKRAGLSLRQGDILVMKHKVVSKSEGCVIDLDTVRPSRGSRVWARRFKTDARVAELVLRESRRIVRRRRGVLITETDHGFVCANSGVDVSNVSGGKQALLLPRDPDRSARQLSRALKEHSGVTVPVIISDSFGRPWREGLTEVAIGITGMKALHDYRGRRDPHGYSLRATVEAVADELACAAGLVCGKLTRTPACIIRGFPYQPGRGRARELIRPAARDLFR